MDIIKSAFGLAEAAMALVGRARRFFYAVHLMGHRCPACSGRLDMTGESKCRCVRCGRELDPTVAFQRCSACGGELVLRVRRYLCRQCGADVPSRFLFDGLAFDTDYFRVKMAEHRQRKAEQRERVRQILADSRSAALFPAGADLADVPGLAAALDGLVLGSVAELAAWAGNEFDLARYESHLQAHIGTIPLAFDQIPPLGEAGRLDRVRRFIAIIFLAHAGLIRVWQDGPSIRVMKHETYGEGQDVSGGVEEADRVAGPVGRVEA